MKAHGVKIMTVSDAHQPRDVGMHIAEISRQSADSGKDNREMGLYFERHGQTDWNVRGKLQGKSDIALNETGRLQAVETREKLKQVAMDAIYCSPLMRARETAEIINVLWELPIQCDDRLMERSFGDMEGALRKDVPFDDLWAFSSASMFAGGEDNATCGTGRELKEILLHMQDKKFDCSTWRSQYSRNSFSSRAMRVWKI